MIKGDNAEKPLESESVVLGGVDIDWRCLAQQVVEDGLLHSQELAIVFILLVASGDQPAQILPAVFKTQTDILYAGGEQLAHTGLIHF